MPNTGEPQLKKKIKTNTKQPQEVQQTEYKKQDFLSSIKSDLSFLIKNKLENLQGKEERADQVYKKIEGLVFKIAFSKIGGRVIQLIMKCSSQQVRKNIFAKLLSNEQSFSEILKSPYGHYIGVTMTRTMVPQYKNQFFAILYKQAFNFAAHQEASQVMQQFLQRCATPSQVQQIKRLFSEGIKKEPESVENLAVKIIEKGLHEQLVSLHILKIALPVLIPVEQEKVVQYFQQMEYASYVFMKEGAQLFCSIVNLSDAKGRKLLIKQISSSFLENLDTKNNYFYIAVLKLLHTIDDTKILNKQITQQLNTHLADYIQQKKGQSIIFSLFIPKHNELTEFEKDQVENKFSKKSQEDRLAEIKITLVSNLVDVLVNVIEDHVLIKDVGFSRFVSALLKYLMQGFPLADSSLFSQLFSRVSKLLLNSEHTSVYSPESEHYWVLTHPDAQRLAKSIILLSNEPSSEEITEEVNKFLGRLVQVVLKRTEICLKSKAIFLLIALVENSSYSEQVRDGMSYGFQVLVELKKKGVERMQSEQGGFNILLKLLE